jgi:hypothetical protein
MTRPGLGEMPLTLWVIVAAVILYLYLRRAGAHLPQAITGAPAPTVTLPAYSGPPVLPQVPGTPGPPVQFLPPDTSGLTIQPAPPGRPQGGLLN